MALGSWKGKAKGACCGWRDGGGEPSSFLFISSGSIVGASHSKPAIHLYGGLITGLVGYDSGGSGASRDVAVEAFTRF